MSNVVLDFFKNLAKQQVDFKKARVKGKVMGAQARVKGKAASKFNKAVEAPGKALKKGASGAKKKAKGAAKGKGGAKPKAPAKAKAGKPKAARPKSKGKAPKGAKGDGMGWFSKKKEAEEEEYEELGYEPAEATVAIDLHALQAQTFQPVVGWLVCLNGELKGRDFRLVDGKNTMGTAADCDVVLTDPYLSSHHTVIRHENGEFTLVDLDSTNGTYVNDRRCSREDLIDNDKIRLGRSELKFKSVE
jgi:hypothetical protein